MTDGPEEPTVSYSVKDLLAQIQTSVTAGFARLETALANKADKADVVAVHARLDEHQRAIEDLKTRQTGDDAVRTARSRAWTTRQWTIGVVVTAVAAAGSVLAVVLR